MGSFFVISITLLGLLVHKIDVAAADGHGENEARCFPTMPSDLEFAKLHYNMDGSIVLPEPAENYSRYNFQWNLRTRTYPFMHIVVLSAEDVREAVLFAKKYNLPVTVKSSGHDFYGRSSADGSFTINMMEMKAIDVTPDATDRSEYGEVKVQTGATWAEIYKDVDKYDRVVVGGSAHDVAPGGYTLGGGHSPISRTFGLAIDNLLEIRVVLADGRISTCTENKTVHLYPDGKTETEMRGDLFWAMRGGGGGTFGVVVDFTFKLHMDRPMVKVTVGCAFYVNTTDLLLAADVLQGFNTFIRTAPSHWGGYFLFNNIPLHINASAATNNIAFDLTGTMTIVLNKFGAWDENTQEELQLLYDLKQSYGDYITPFMVENKTGFWDYEKDISDEKIGRIYNMGTLVPLENYNDSFNEFIIDELLNHNDGVMIACTTTLLGGKVQEYSVQSSSVHPGFRSAQAWIGCGVIVSAWWDFSLETHERQASLKPKAEALASRLRKFGNGEYVNEGDPNNPNWKLDNWGEQYPDLLRIKARYDPTNFFTCHHCVGSDRETFVFTSASATIHAGVSTLIMLLLSIMF